MFATHVLLLEGDPKQGASYVTALNRAGLLARHVTTPQAAIDQIYPFDPDVIYMHWRLADDTTCAPLLEHLATIEARYRPQIMLVADVADTPDIGPSGEIVNRFFEGPVLAWQLVDATLQLARQSENRLPAHDIQIQNLAPGVFHQKWAGRITRGLIRELMQPELLEAHTVVFDLLDLSLERVNMGAIGMDRHPDLPKLRRVHVVHREGVRKTVELLMAFLPKGLEIDYHTSLEEAYHAAGIS